MYMGLNISYQASVDRALLVSDKYWQHLESCHHPESGHYSKSSLIQTMFAILVQK